MDEDICIHTGERQCSCDRFVLATIFFWGKKRWMGEFTKRGTGFCFCCQIQYRLMQFSEHVLHRQFLPSVKISKSGSIWFAAILLILFRKMYLHFSCDFDKKKFSLVIFILCWIWMSNWTAFCLHLSLRLKGNYYLFTDTMLWKFVIVGYCLSHIDENWMFWVVFEFCH